MKNLVKISLSLLCVVIVLIGIIYKSPLHKTNKENSNSTQDFTIIYKYGGGFGTIESTVTKKVTINQDGLVSISLDDKRFQYKEVKYSVDKENVRKLAQELLDGPFMTLDKDISDYNADDASSSYIEINSNNKNHKVGGYCASCNKIYSKIEKKVWSFIDDNKLKEFKESIKLK